VSDIRLFQQTWPEGEYRFFQLGFVVDDLYGAAERWARVFGVGPFHVLPRVEARCTYRGRPAVLDMQVAVAQAGPVQIELIHDFSQEETIFAALRSMRSGFHQLSTLTADYDATRAHYIDLGYELTCEIVRPEQRVAYFDTVAEFGFYTEVTEAVPQFVAALARISRTCAEWDGTDPVRLLTRDGYRVP
jgi:Glyoxalase/Bleomycin resistance protein/Dioxygenase superfamily